MGLGRTTRFAPLPPGARRVSVMRQGAGGLKALAPSPELLAAFVAEKRGLVKDGLDADRAHAEASRRAEYRTRFRAEIRSNPAALDALRQVVAESKVGDLYLMCMCPWRTRDEACHTYLLLDLARELDPSVAILPEPTPRRAARRKPPTSPSP